ncbi:phenylacetic acid degradation protein [Candidatus Poribacteria bacterium]|nr:phenylacetic acid degradation protein [Candidatus Poribacteria bacterium]
MRRLFIATLLLFLIQSIVYADIFDYVSKEDKSFKWEKVNEEPLPNDFMKFGLEFTSQTWKEIPLKHRLNFIKPKEVKNPTKVFLLITGSGSGRDELIYGSAISAGIGAPLAILHDVPHQPLFGKLKEDALIAYTFQKTLETGDMEWPLLFSMTKTAVRAMDMIQEFTKKDLGFEVDGFVVSGGSKRGWTTWFTAAVDKRVKGIAPLVYDNLNLARQMEHQIETWGKYSEQIDDYTRLGIQQQLNNEKGKELSKLVDPFTYRDKITTPKLIVNGTNDRYWTLDALNQYYDELVGEKYILYVPNKGHDVGDFRRVINNAIAFSLKVDGKMEFPKISWNYKEKNKGTTIIIKSDVKPVSVSIWTTESSTKDFRDSVWKETKIEPKKSAYKYNLKKPESGYVAMFGEAVYNVDGREFFLSTNVHIIEPK